LQHALNVYDNPACVSLTEFKRDLDRFSQIKKAITRFKDSSFDINTKLVMNNIVICFNVFGNKALDFLVLKIPMHHWDVLFPFLIVLNRLPETIDGYPTSEVQLNNEIINNLRKIITCK
jgi:hypothetical protein